jgi:hypothetical protein
MPNIMAIPATMLILKSADHSREFSHPEGAPSSVVSPGATRKLVLVDALRFNA